MAGERMADLNDAFDKLLADAQASDQEGESKRRKKDKKKDKKDKKEKKRAKTEAEAPAVVAAAPTAAKMIEIVCNDRLGNKVRIKCKADDTIGNVKKIIAAQSGHRADKIRLQKWYTVFKVSTTRFCAIFCLARFVFFFFFLLIVRIRITLRLQTMRFTTE